jgi:hypothetical protein
MIWRVAARSRRRRGIIVVTRPGDAPPHTGGRGVATGRGAVSASVGAALIGAGMISVLVYLLIASALIPAGDGGEEKGLSPR